MISDSKNSKTLIRPATERPRRSPTQRPRKKASFRQRKEIAESPRQSLRLTPYAWAKLLYLRDLGDTEVSGFGITAADDLLLVEDVRLVRQVCTGVSVALDDEAVADWWHEHVSPDWTICRQEIATLLHRESELQEIVRLVGPDALPDDQRWLLWVARLVREGFLQQSAMDPVDAYTTPTKQILLHPVIL